MSAREQHPIEYLFNEQKKLPYHRWYGVEPVKEMIARTAFFPGGSGLWLGRSGSWYIPSDRPDMPEGKVMVLGQNFGSKCDHEKYLREDAYDLDCKTWKNLLQYLDYVGIDPKHCFFTNAYMGLMEEDPSGKEFKECCRSFLDKQIKMQKPQLILALGAYVIELIAELSPDDLAEWRPWRNFEKLDCLGPVRSASFNDSTSATVVALVHPSAQWTAAFKNRHYDAELKGKDAELAMLKDALKQSRLQ